MSAPDLTTPAGRLADASMKLHMLLTGRSLVEVMVDGYLTRFQRADIPELKAYVATLSAEVSGFKSVGAIGITYLR